jgi:hypothetical protein
VVFGYDYTSLKPKTRRMYDAALDYIAKWLGPLPVRGVTEAIVLERLKAIARQRHEGGPHNGRRKIATANALGRVGRMLWHASRTLFAPTTPATSPRRATRGPACAPASAASGRCCGPARAAT